MTELYTVVAAFAVMALTDVVKKVVGWISQMIPKLPSWVVSLKSLWTLAAAIAVTALVYFVSKRYEVALEHPLAILILAQITHEAIDAVRKAKATREEG